MTHSIFARTKTSFTQCSAVAALGLATVACGGAQAEPEGPSDAEREAKAAEANCDAEEALLQNDEPIDDGFDEETPLGDDMPSEERETSGLE